MKPLDAFRRNNEIVDIIFQHKGIENAIGTKELASALDKKGYKTRPDLVHYLVRKIILERHLPICSVGQRGYYWGSSKQDIQAAIDDLQNKIDGLQERIDLLKSFIF